MAVLHEALGLICQQANAGQVTLVIDRSAAPAWVQANATRLKQVLVNLTINAVKYTRVGGEVRFAIRPNAATGRTRIEVQDTGSGLTAEQLTHLFRPFDRIGHDRKGTAGTGIGLVISKELVTAMGGTLDFESEVGRGTCVTVTLADASAPHASSAKPLGELPSA